MNLWRSPNPTSLLKAGSATEGFPGLHPVRFRASSRIKVAHRFIRELIPVFNHPHRKNKTNKQTPPLLDTPAQVSKAAAPPQGQVSYKKN